MRNFIKYLMVGLLLGSVFPAMGHIGPKQEGNQGSTITSATLRADCTVAQASIDQSLNNVRTTLLTGGDVWWNGNEARYIVPKVDPLSGLPEVSSIFAGAVWLGGFDEAGNLKIACQQYGTGSGETDFWPGPLTEIGTTSQDTCADWDRFFKVTGEEIDQHLANYASAVQSGEAYNPDLIPDGVKFWPGRGNPFFNDPGGYDFELPGTQQGLAGYHDAPGSILGVYDPDGGDYPIIEIRGCADIYYPDEMIYWIYNDAGAAHTETNGDAIRMEVQVQAFAYKTNDEVNDMTFMRYKLINRAIETIDSTFFAMWVDPDLGCYLDDYIGCDTSRSLMYIYNQDGADGEPGFTCPGGVNTYGDEIPVLGVDYFRGPTAPKVFGPDSLLYNPLPGETADTIIELGMSSFTYFNGANATQGTGDPATAPQFYNYLSGRWLDGLPYTIGGDGHNPGQTNVTNYAFPFPPDQIGAWSMAQEGLGTADRRTVQASGPFRLEPGAVNELIVGVVWVPNVDHPAPDITRLLAADDVAQALFDNCFVLPDGPDAPSVDWIELDREVVAVLTNDKLLSNNAFELYEENDLRFNGTNDDSTYVFEGYKLYQLAASDVNISQLDDPDRARLIAQVDVKNNVMDLYNWESIANPTAETSGASNAIWTPVLKVEDARNDGAKHLFKITEDQFATSDRKLINHKKYYFVALAYGFNEHAPFDPGIPEIGQRKPYIEGRKNIGDKLAGTDYYTVIPRPIIDRDLNAGFGDGPEITRLDGHGVGQNFIRLTEESETAILNGTDDGEVVYQGGSGPIGVIVYNPLDLKEADFDIRIVDSNLDDKIIDENANWVLREFDDGGNVINTVESERDISFFNEQILAEYGFAISLSQSDIVGGNADESNGLIGVETSYENEEGNLWYGTVLEGPGFPNFYNFIKTDANEVDFSLDPEQSLSTIGNGDWVPYTLCDWRPQAGGAEFISPSWIDPNSDIVRVGNGLDSLNNVDIVFTSNKDLWSRCVVVETANSFYAAQGVETEGGAQHFDLRQGESVDKEGKGEGGSGMGWFPGYAIDPMTGERLNIFFGENSAFSCDEPNIYSSVCDQGGFTLGDPTGRDMIWNPSAERFIQTGAPFFNVLNALEGGQHFIYVTREQYDGCEKIRQGLQGTNIDKLFQLRKITWSSFPVLPEGVSLLPVSEGLIPNNYKVSLRVDRPYTRDQKPKLEEYTGTGINNRYPTYAFSTIGLGATELDEAGIDSALDMINVVPNPYYGFSAYETSQFTNVVKITNLPAQCTVTVFSLDGKFIRQYKRDAQGVPTNERNNPALDISQYAPDIEWDLKNNKSIPVASGVYLIHIDAGDMGERVIKWFGVARQFDPSGL